MAQPLRLVKKVFDQWSRNTMQIIISYKYKHKDFRIIEINEDRLRIMYGQNLSEVDAATLIIGETDNG